jgi:hypothetical protein
MNDEELVESMALRRLAWERARDLVSPIVDQHDLVERAPGVFQPYASSKVDQHTTQIMEVAEWLLRED